MTEEKKVPISTDEVTEDEVEVSEKDDAADEEVVDPVVELEAKLKETTDRLMRTAADLDNFRKRARRDTEDAAIRGRSEILREIIPVIDSIDLALRSANPEGSAAAIVEGVEMVRRQFMTATEKFGLKAVEARGTAFDPNFHEAMAQVTSDEAPAGQVVEEMRKGYVLGERLLRPSMVIVSKGPPAEEAEPETRPESETTPEIAEEEEPAAVEGEVQVDEPAEEDKSSNELNDNAVDGATDEEQIDGGDDGGDDGGGDDGDDNGDGDSDGDDGDEGEEQGDES